MSNEQNTRRDFFKKASLSGIAAMTIPFSGIADNLSAPVPGLLMNEPSELNVPKVQGLRITGTFLDEISHDIPHRTGGRKNGTKILPI